MSPWPNVPLGEVLSERREKPLDDALARGQLRIVLKIGFNDGLIQLRTYSHTRTDMILIRPGDLVISGINAVKGAIAIYGEENVEPIAATIHYGAYVVNQQRADITYLWRLLRSGIFQELLKDHLPGGIKTELKAKRLLEIPVPLPSLEEQRRIVARIEELASKINEARGLRQVMAGKTETLLASAKASVFSRASSGGVMRELDEVAPINMGQSPPGLSYNKSGNGVPLLNGPTEFGPHHPMAVQWTTAPTKLCKEGDILICVRGATTGRMNWADRQYCIGRGLAALTPQSDVCEPGYIYHFVETQTQIMLSLAAGTTFPNLPRRKMMRLKIPVPPISEQRRIVAYLDELREGVDALKQLESETSGDLDRLLPSILDKAFKGELS